MKKLVQLIRGNSHHSGLLVNEFFLDHVDGNLQRGGRRALSHPGLEHIQLAFLHSEFNIEHVLIVFFQLLYMETSVRYAAGKRFFSSAIWSGVRIPATTSSPCALISRFLKKTSSRRWKGRG